MTVGKQEFLLQCLDLLGGDAPEFTAPDNQQLTLELPLSDDLRLNVSVTWDEPSGRFLASIQSASQESGELPLNEWLLSPTLERASLAARWLQASASPIAPVIAESGVLEWQTWLLPNDRGVGGFGEFVAWAMAFHTLFGIEPDQRGGALRTLPPSPEDWLEVDRLLNVQWTPGQWAQALAARAQVSWEWVDPTGPIFSYAWPEGDQPGMATAVLQEMGQRLGLPGSDLGPTLARLNGLLHPQSCCLALDGRQNLRLLATLAPASAERDLERLPELAQAVRGLLQLRQQAGEQTIEHALSAGWVPDTLMFR